MFYDANSINRILICLNCLQRFNIPKLLPCGESICERCLSKLVSNNNKNKIFCPYCKIHHESSTMYEGFPTEKILLEILNMKPVKVYRGHLFSKTELLMQQSKLNLQNLKSTLNNKLKIITVNASLLREKLKDKSLVHKIDEYEIDCYKSFKHYFDPLANNNYYDEYFSKFHEKISRHLEFLQVFITKSELSDHKMKFAFKLASHINVSIKLNQNFLNSILFDKKILLLNNDEIDFKFYYDFDDVLNIPRRLLQNDDDNIKKQIIDYKNNSYFNNDFAKELKKEIKNIWISIFQNNYLIIFLQIYNYLTNKMEINLKLTNSNGDLIKDVCLNDTSDDSLYLITLTNTNLHHFDSNFVLVAVENISISATELHLLSVVDLKLIKKIKLENYKPVFLSFSEMTILALSRQVPFIHQLNFFVDDEKSLLEEYKAFGQNIDRANSFYMSNKIIQISSKFNDELLYVCFGSDKEDEIRFDDEEDINLIKIYSLSTKELIRKIKLPLYNCLVHIDSLLRIVVIDKTKRIMSVFTEILFDDNDILNYEFEHLDNYKLDKAFEKNEDDVGLNLLYKCSLKHISGNISTFCIAKGYVLINDSTNRIIYIL
jgi:hypothetical protein